MWTPKNISNCMFCAQVCVNYQGTSLLVWLWWKMQLICLYFAFVFGFVIFFCINVDQQGALVSVHAVASSLLAPSVWIQQSWLAPTTEQAQPICCFTWQREGMCVQTKQGLKLTLGRQSNTFSIEHSALLRQFKNLELYWLLWVNSRKCMNAPSPLQWLLIVIL